VIGDRPASRIEHAEMADQSFQSAPVSSGCHNHIWSDARSVRKHDAFLFEGAHRWHDPQLAPLDPADKLDVNHWDHVGSAKLGGQPFARRRQAVTRQVTVDQPLHHPDDGVANQCR
jgi:hypothetical protein